MSEKKPQSAREFFYRGAWSSQREQRQPNERDLGTWDAAFCFAEAFRDASQRQPQSVSEEQLQKAADEIRAAMIQLDDDVYHDRITCTWQEAIQVFDFMSVLRTTLGETKSAFKEEL